jgi:hypothetical protein
MFSETSLKLNQIEKCNEFSSKFGLVLTKWQIRILLEEKISYTKKYGRVETG